MTNEQVTDALLLMARLNRRLLERLYDLEASVSSVKTVVGRLSGVSEPSEAAREFSGLERQFRELQPERQGLEQVDALILLLQQGKHPDVADS